MNLPARGRDSEPANRDGLGASGATSHVVVPYVSASLCKSMFFMNHEDFAAE
jgi:hypothetical protein